MQPAITAAVAHSFHYRSMSGAELMRLEPAFDLLPSSEGLRRGCVLVRDGPQAAGGHRRSLRFGVRPGWKRACLAC